jgi:hypothetical protein
VIIAIGIQIIEELLDGDGPPRNGAEPEPVELAVIQARARWAPTPQGRAFIESKRQYLPVIRAELARLVAADRKG